MKRLLVVVDWPKMHNGGASRVVVETCRRLRARGYETGVAHHMPGPSEVEGPSWQLPGESTTSDAEMANAIRPVLEAFRPDLVQAHARRLTGVLDLLLRHAPVCQFVHDQSYYCGGGHRMTRGNVPCHRPHGPACLAYNYLLGCGGKDPRNNWSWWRSAQSFTAIRRHPTVRLQVASRLMRDGLLENGHQESRIDRVPLYAEPARRPSAPEPGRVLVPGRLVREKGVFVVIEAMARLKDRPWTLCMPGPGPHAGRARELAAALGIAGRTEFPGELGPDAMEREYARCEFVVFPVLRYEPFGLIGPEAMAYGRPIVAFGGGGVDEWLRPEETGIRVDSRTPEALAEGIRRLLDDPALRARLGEGATRHYPTFHPDAYLDRLEESFARTAAGWRDSRGTNAGLGG